MVADILIALFLFFIVIPVAFALLGQLIAETIKKIGEFFQLIGACVDDVRKAFRLCCRFLKFCKSKIRGSK